MLPQSERVTASHTDAQAASVKVFEARGFAFVRYKLRVCGEFAKEAMANQTLRGFAQVCRHY